MRKGLCALLVLLSSVAVRAQSARDLVLPAASLPQGWTILDEREIALSDLSSISLIDAAGFQSWGFREAFRQAYATPRGLAYVIVEIYGAPSGSSARLDDKKRNPTPGAKVAPFADCGSDGIRTEFLLQGNIGAHKIFFSRANVFVWCDSFDSGVSTEIARLICPRLPGGGLPGQEPQPPPSSPAAKPAVEISAPAELAVLPFREIEFGFEVRNAGSRLDDITVEVRSGDPAELQVISGSRFSLPRFLPGETWREKAVVKPVGQGPRFKAYVFVNDSAGNTLRYWSINFRISPVDLEFQTPASINADPPQPSEIAFVLVNRGRELDSIQVRADFKTSPLPGHAYVKPSVPRRSFRTGEALRGTVTVQMNAAAAGPFTLFLQAVSGPDVLAETKIRVDVAPGRSPRNTQTFLQVKVDPNHLWLLPDEIKSLTVSIENAGDVEAIDVVLEAKSADPSWVQVLGERREVRDPSTGASRLDYLTPEQRPRTINAGESRSIVLDVKAGKVDTDYVNISARGVNTDQEVAHVLIRISPPATPRTEDEKISALFDPSKPDRVMFRTMRPDEMYRWEGGKLFHGDCTDIPLHGPSCDHEETPGNVVYMAKDLSRLTGQGQALNKIYSDIQTQNRQARSNIRKIALGAVAWKSDLLASAGLIGETEAARSSSQSGQEYADMAEAILGPAADAYNLVGNLEERHDSLEALKEFFPRATFGYIHHKKKVGGKWVETYDRAFFIQKPNSDTWYVYVVHESLQ